MTEIKQPAPSQGPTGAGGYARERSRYPDSGRHHSGEREPDANLGHAVADTASIMGIPLKSVTPQVQDAITKLMQEVEMLRAELQRSHERERYLESLADQDPLLPINNRRFFMREIKRIMAHSERSGAPSSLLYMEISNAEEIKTNYGHAAREGALIQAALILKSETRASDVIGNLGGNGIGVILAIADERGATRKAAAFKAAFSDRPFMWIGKVIYLDVELVWHTFTADDDGEEVLRELEKKTLGLAGTVPAK